MYLKKTSSLSLPSPSGRRESERGTLGASERCLLKGDCQWPLNESLCGGGQRKRVEWDLAGYIINSFIITT